MEDSAAAGLPGGPVGCVGSRAAGPLQEVQGAGDFRWEYGFDSFVHRAAGLPLGVGLIDFVHESLNVLLGTSIGSTALATSFIELRGFRWMPG